MLKRLHIILLTSLFAFTLNGQDNDLKFTHLSINEGLSGRLVKSILQDREGFMWFGTKNNGLNKYDGYNFKVFKYDSTRENTISGNSILCLFQSTDGMIWIGTKNNGLN